MVRPSTLPALPLALLGGLALPAKPAHQEAAQEPDDPDPPVRVEVHVESFVDLYYEVRSLAASGELPPEDLRGAVEAARELGRQLGSALAWGVVDGHLHGCSNIHEVGRAFEDLPDELRVPAPGGERVVALRPLALEMVLPILEAAPQWMESVWPEREGPLEEAAQRLRDTLVAKEAAVYADLALAFGMQPEGLVAPIHVVTRTPPPGGFTFRARGGAGVSFVSVEQNPGTQLLEAALHESIHVLDIADGHGSEERGGSVLAELRAALRAAGVAATDPRYRDAPHTLYFLVAADLVRAHLDHGHEDYGDVAGYYAKVPEVIAVERPLWKRYRSGDISAGELVEGIVGGLTGK